MTEQTATLADMCKSVSISSVRGTTPAPWAEESRNRRVEPPNHYRVTLKYQGREYSLDFWQGTGIKGTPTAESVLECLLSDASSACESFANWCSEYGYDTDSRKALASYLQCQEIDTALHRLLGADFSAFMDSSR